MSALDDALYAKLSGDATLMALVPGGVHNLVARKPGYPFLVFQKVSCTPSYTLTQIIRETYVYQIRCIGKGATSKATLESALLRVQALLNRQPLTVTGYTHWITEREGDIADVAELDEDGEVLIQVGATYRIEVRAEE